MVVGAGHAGLAMSYCLTQHGVKHVVLERGGIAERWRSERWDSLTLLTPNWATQLPGFHYAGPQPDGFDSRSEYLGYLERYAASFGAPVRTNTTVTRVRADGDHAFTVETSHGTLRARNVVAATGPFHEPNIPAASQALSPDVFQLHSSQYKRPGQLPAGAVLVVGGGNSGLQIVVELLHAGRKVFLSAGTLRGMPRRYRGRDAIGWLQDFGSLDTPAEHAAEEMAKTPPPMLSGVDGGHDLNLRDMAERGAVFVGRLLGGSGVQLQFSPDIDDILRRSAEAYRAFRARADQLVADRGLTMPPDPAPCADADLIPVVSNPQAELNLDEAGVRSVVWATGFRQSYPWIDLPIVDESGRLKHSHGVSEHRGLYFLGLRWLSKYKSFFIYGVGEDAERLAAHIASRR